MSTYGIEIFNSVGELVLSSDRRTVRILQAGTFSFGWAPETVKITFPPVTERPQVFAQTTGLLNVYSDWERIWNPFQDPEYTYWSDRWAMAPAMGIFEKNSDGKYHLINFHNINAYKWDSEQRGYAPLPNIGEQFTNIPYVIFI